MFFKTSFPPDLKFHAVSLAVAVVACVATSGTTSVMPPAPAMFLGWVAFNLAGSSLRDGLANANHQPLDAATVSFVVPATPVAHAH